MSIIDFFCEVPTQAQCLGPVQNVNLKLRNVDDIMVLLTIWNLGKHLDRIVIG